MELDKTAPFSSYGYSSASLPPSREVFNGVDQQWYQETAKRKIDAEIIDLVSEWFPESEYVSLVKDPNTGKTYKVVDIEKLKEGIKIERRVNFVRYPKIKTPFLS